MALRVVFMGTPDFSVATLEAILAAGHDVIAVYSQPPRRSGRGMQERKSPVHQCADAAGIPVLTPENLKSGDAKTAFEAHRADVAVVVAYGLLLPAAVLDAPVHGCLNIHASLLPRWRGAAPINRAIMAGDTETGVMVMKMDQGLDTGPVALTDRIAIGDNETAGELHDRLAVAGAGLAAKALDELEQGRLAFTDQPDTGITYAHKLSKDETRIDWSEPGEAVHNHIRGLSPFPGAWCMMTFGDRQERVKILAATRADGAGDPGTVLDGDLTVACGTGAVRLERVQRSGKQALARPDFLRGTSVPKGTRLA